MLSKVILAFCVDVKICPNVGAFWWQSAYQNCFLAALLSC